MHSPFYLHEAYGRQTATKIELAKDLALKCKQIELLITNLPGIGVSEDEQQGRLRNLESAIKEAELERQNAIAEKVAAKEKLDKVICNLKRI